MASLDIMPFSSPLGGTVTVQHGYLDASETFLTGEPVRITASGTISEAADEPVDSGIVGISAQPGSTAVTNPKTNENYTTNDLVSYWPAHPTQLWVTKNFATDGAGTQAAPAQTNIGDQCGLSLTTGTWSLDTGVAAGAMICRVVDVLNSQKESIVTAGTTLAATDTFYVVFQIIASQLTPDSGLVIVPPAA